jgi:hypothetical protein
MINSLDSSDDYFNPTNDPKYYSLCIFYTLLEQKTKGKVILKY